jgi:ABC-2 type transport system permease protein
VIRAYIALTRAALLEAVQYRFSLVIWLFGRIIQPVVYLSVWNAVAKARGGQVGGYTPQDFAAYYILISLVELWTASNNLYMLPRGIRLGTLSQHLLKPLHPLHREICSVLGFRIVETAIMAPALVALCYFFHPNFTVTPQTLLWAIPALLLANVIRFMLEAWVGFSAFWIVRTSSFTSVYYLLLFFFSGQAAPTSLLPAAARALSQYLPFRWIFQFPVDVFLGRLSAMALAQGFAFQAGWIFLGALITWSLWHRGLKTYTAVGS